MLNEALKLIRLFHEQTQRELANHLGISVSYLSEIEAGNRRINVELLSKYSEAFNIPASSLMLFSEQLEQKSLNRTRIKVADKILKVMSWAAEEGGIDEQTQKAG